MSNYSPTMGTRIPDRILIDLNPVIYQISVEYPQPDFYLKFSIRDIIATLLTSAMLNDDGEYIWFEVENRFDTELDTMDMDGTQILFFTITEVVDEYIRQQLPPSFPQEAYIFDRWIDNTTVILKLDETQAYHHCL